MITVLPNGYLTILEAAEVLSQTLCAGVPDLPIVSELRKMGLDVGDRQATDRAIAELWKECCELWRSVDGLPEF